MAPPVEEKEVSVDGPNQTLADVGLIGGETVPKVRKPYTITKQREKWTEEDHKKFLKALQLYGRDWRRIEEHIGTKTTVQIRSHAQKFFSKVAKESPGGTSIGIPPPRPKRKPIHPYPRKLGNQKAKVAPALKQLENPLVQDSPVTEQGMDSPSSVLSNIGSENLDQDGCRSPFESCASGSNDPDSRSQSPAATSTGDCIDPVVPTIESDQDTQAPCIKLFGKTVMLSVSKNDFLNENAKSKKEPVESDRQREQRSSGANPFVYYVPYTADETNVPMMAQLPWWSVYGTWSYPFINQTMGNFGQGQQHEKEISGTGSSTYASEVVDETSEAGEREENISISSKKKEDKLVTGFAPYKRRKVEADKQGKVKLGFCVVPR